MVTAPQHSPMKYTTCPTFTRLYWNTVISLILRLREEAGNEAKYPDQSHSQTWWERPGNEAISYQFQAVWRSHHFHQLLQVRKDAKLFWSKEKQRVMTSYTIKTLINHQNIPDQPPSRNKYIHSTTSMINAETLKNTNQLFKGVNKGLDTCSQIFRQVW